jgi:phosphoribosylglycinamide formyltransferase-1
VLAGFMRILSPEFVKHFAGRIINIHPSLLPAYKGLNTHQRALNAGESHHGVSVHLVIPDLDAGPIIGQAQLNIEPHDTAASLQQRVQAMEYKLYPFCLALIASGQVQLSADTVTLNLAKSTQLQQASIQDQTIAQCHETGMIICTEEMILATTPIPL